MLVTHLHKLIAATVKVVPSPAAEEKIQLNSPLKSKPQAIFWLVLSLTFSAIYSYMAWREGTASEYVVQDDARQHVFWMLRFLDPELFPGDRIADYFQAVAPTGYTVFYRLFTVFGIDPLLLNKLLPAVLGLITTSYCFGVCLQIFPLPAAGFTASLLLNQQIWMKDDLASATPRAFAYPLFMAFLYYLLRRSVLGIGVAIALLALFYPHYVLVAAGILIVRLADWEHGRLGLTTNRRDYLLCFVGLAVALVALLPFALESSEYGPAITAEAARQLPEFAPGGRTEFFHSNSWHYWLNGQRSGILPQYFFTPATVYAGLLLPILLKFPTRLPLVKQVTSGVMLLLQMLLASTCLFFAAHALLFKLHVPSRYTGMSQRIILALAAGIGLIIILDAVFRWAAQRANSDKQARRQLIALGAVTLVGAVLVFYPATIAGFPFVKYKVGKVPGLYEFFQQQPQDVLVASLAEEAGNIPAFSHRSVLVSREYAIPYQVGYYSEFRQRTLELIRAQYSPNWAEIESFVQKYGVDFWLLDRAAFTTEYLTSNEWIGQYQPAVKQALAQLEQGIVPALAKIVPSCTVFETEELVVLAAKCPTAKVALP